MQRNLTKGPITVNLLLFALPLMFGNLLQQLYNVADTWVVGRYLGANALAAVGSSYTLMTFLTSIKGLMKDYLWVIFLGILATFLYNYFANLLRAIGNSMLPLLFLAVSSILNIILDLLFVLKFHWGVQGAAGATVFSQYVSGIGILMVQGLVNSFGTVIMAAFAAAVKIDSFAYMPVQDFGNAFSTYVAQNYGAKEEKRIKGNLDVSADRVVFGGHYWKFLLF